MRARSFLLPCRSQGSASVLCSYRHRQEETLVDSPVTLVDNVGRIGWIWNENNRFPLACTSRTSLAHLHDLVVVIRIYYRYLGQSHNPDCKPGTELDCRKPTNYRFTTYLHFTLVIVKSD